jgi:SAM-dependent methyltransferase
LPKNFYHRRDCRLCKSKDLELAVPLKKIPLTEKYLENKNLNKDSTLFPIDLYMCRSCSHVQILDVINPDILWDNYTFRSGLAETIISHLHDVAERICKKYNIGKKSLVIDVGSNDGTLLQGYKNKNMEVLGIDPAKEIAAEANNSGVNTISEFLNEKLSKDIVDEYGKAKVINCFNAFAHADNMIELTKSIVNLMSKDGIFVFEVSYLVDIIEKTLLGAVIHEHLSHHSLLSLEVFLKKFNLELIYVERNSFQGGSIVGVAQFINGPYGIDESVKRLIEYEKLNKFNKLEKIKSFSAKLNKINDQLRVLIKKYIKEKKK